jgi:hypothetical protein
MNLEYLEEAKEIMQEAREDHGNKGFSQEALDICNGATLNKIARREGEVVAYDNKQRTD